MTKKEAKELAETRIIMEAMSGAKFFVVTESSFEYNDECYSQSEGGTPIAITISEDTAKRVTRERTIAWVRDLISDSDDALYAYASYDFRDRDEKFDEALREIVGDTEHDKLSDEQLLTIYDKLLLNCFEYTQTKLTL